MYDQKVGTMVNFIEASGHPRLAALICKKNGGQTPTYDVKVWGEDGTETFHTTVPYKSSGPFSSYPTLTSIS